MCRVFYCYADCHYDDCRYAECRSVVGPVSSPIHQSGASVSGIIKHHPTVFYRKLLFYYY